ncbi:MAG: prepilin peptidase [Ilumatobacteraceae bacterium]
MQRAILGDQRQFDDGAGLEGRRAAALAGSITSRLLAATCVAGIALVAARWFDEAPAVVATGLSLLILTGAALVDVAERRLPNELVAAAAIPVGVAAAVAMAAGTSSIATGAIGGAALVGAPLLATHVVSPAGMGFGDVKAGTVLGAAVGLVSVPAAAGTLLLALAGSGLWAVMRRRRHVALGPGLVLGAVMALGAARALGVEAN